MVWDPLFFAVFYDWMIAGASCMCCILSITEAGKQPEQPRSKTSRQFSISAVQLKSAAKLSEEFRLWTVNGKGNDTDMRKKNKKWGIFYYFGQFPAVISLHCCYSSAKSGSPDCPWAAPLLFLCSGNLGKSRWAERGGSEVIPHSCPLIPEWRSQGPERSGYFLLLWLLCASSWYSWSSIPCFFKNKETELPVFWMSEHISRGKKKTNQNIAPRTARLKQFHPRFLWSYP